MPGKDSDREHVQDPVPILWSHLLAAGPVEGVYPQQTGHMQCVQETLGHTSRDRALEIDAGAIADRPEHLPDETT